MSTFESLLRDIPQSIEAYNVTANLLAGTRLTYNNFVAWYIESNRVDTKAKRFHLVEAMLDEAYNNPKNKAIESNTAYKAFHAITYMNTHMGRKTKFAEEQRLTTKSNHTQKALDSLLLLAV